ncbi:hypothetical protein IOD16_30735 [Saccharothrix sp. 6-C]|uniref:Uncharacterized protein n=1 Tax=Saccharothrix texasensis TaxID=103734 RepID=A0A3N1HDR8_9PSEU|nr:MULTISPECIES: hypothetical protein [Saccharothrix]QQQ75434.1 hypothetical protein IOD16_30735 [Saccharothrix sp. 6-C]ROP40442.1 hypothetical protein EDD40_5854 [Saccharothrix texasensis]
MFCTVGRPLSLTSWLAVPFLFSIAVLGLTGLGGLLVGAPGQLALSSPVFGAGVAVGVATSGAVGWTARWQRAWLRWPYLAAVLAVGVLLDGVRVPVAAVVGLGVPVTALLVAQYFLERRRTAALAEAGLASPTPPC